MINIQYRAAAIFVTATIFTEPAFAYLDPGTGGMLIQIVLGGLAGLAVAGKLFWHQLKSFFRIGNSEETKNRTDDP